MKILTTLGDSKVRDKIRKSVARNSHASEILALTRIKCFGFLSSQFSMMSNKPAASAPVSSWDTVTRKPRRYSDMKKREPPVELTRVYMYEVAEEINDEHILKELAEYGEIASGVTRHRHKGYTIENGVRSVGFHGQPGTIWVDGNKLKVRYDSQDRTL